MNTLIRFERTCLYGHILSMAFGLAGLLLVLPHPEFIANLSDFGKFIFRWSMAGGGVIYMLLGMMTVALYAYRNLGRWHWLTFMIPSVGLSLGSELLGTSTGFPFGHYRYLTGLGYKIAGLVPFTIPLSWFYLGFCAYLITRAGLSTLSLPRWVNLTGSIVIGSILLTSWDFVLDPAMSQTTMPFWVWDQPGAFFGMPYQNFVGWFGTGVVFMSVATILWEMKPFDLPYGKLALPLAVYLSNFAFSMIMSVGAAIYPPIFLGILTGVIPILVLYKMAQGKSKAISQDLSAVSVPVASVGVFSK